MKPAELAMAFVVKEYNPTVKQLYIFIFCFFIRISFKTIETIHVIPSFREQFRKHGFTSYLIKRKP